MTLRRTSHARTLAFAASVVLLALGTSLSAAPEGTAPAGGPPFGLPFAAAPGPATWLAGQLYGNTTGAYFQADEWYAAGQGLHFGIDLLAPCGTPVVSIG